MNPEEIFENSDLYLSHMENHPTYPQIIQLEITSKCNLRCIFCPVWCESRQRAQNETSISYERILSWDKMFEQAYEIELTGFGEALLHPHLLDILRYFKNKKCNVNLTTNGQLLSENISKIIVAENLINLICVSVDAGTAKTYSSLRPGGNFDTLCENLFSFNKIRKNQSKSRPFLHLSFIAMKRNIHELPGAVKLAKTLGAQKMIVQGLTESDHLSGERITFLEDEVQFYEQAAQISESMDIDLEFWYQTTPNDQLNKRHPYQKTGLEAFGRHPIKNCRYPWERVFIKSNLEVQPCATLWEKMIMGRLDRDDILTIWNGNKYKALRRQICSTNTPPDCIGCPTKSWISPIKMEEMSSSLQMGNPDCRQLGSGFYPVEGSDRQSRHRWIRKKSTLFFPNEKRPFLDYEFYFHPEASLAGELIINGQVLDHFASTEIFKSPIRFALPFFDEDILEVTLSFNREINSNQINEEDDFRPLCALVKTAELVGNTGFIKPVIKTGGDDYQQLGRGFYDVETTMSDPARWTCPAATFVIKRSGKILCLRLGTIHKEKNRIVEITFDGKYSKIHPIPDRAGIFEVLTKIPPGGDWVAVRMETNCSFKPPPPDTRRLGILFFEARVT